MALTAQHKKLAAAIVLLLLAGGLMYFRGREKPPLPNSIEFVCVNTGKHFHLDRNDVDFIPTKNPETGQDTLFPVSKGDDGKQYVSRRYRDALKELAENNRYVDLDNLQVRSGP